MSKPTEATRCHNLTKLLIILPLRDNSKSTFQCETPCAWALNFSDKSKQSTELHNFALALTYNHTKCFVSMAICRKVKRKQKPALSIRLFLHQLLKIYIPI